MTTTIDDLCEFERDILLEACGFRKARSWGAAVGAAMETLCGRGLVTNFPWQPTSDGVALAREIEAHRGDDRS